MRNPSALDIRFDYSISGWVFIGGKLVIRRIGLTELVAEYARLDSGVPAHLVALNDRGERYSYESFDALGAAVCELYRSDPLIWERIGRAERGSIAA